MDTQAHIIETFRDWDCGQKTFCHTVPMRAFPQGIDWWRTGGYTAAIVFCVLVWWLLARMVL